MDYHLNNLSPAFKSSEDNEIYMGSWRHPRVDVIKRVVSNLSIMSMSPDLALAYNSGVALVCGASTLLVGIRPPERGNLVESQFDGGSGLLPLYGKSTRSRENSRYLPYLDPWDKWISWILKKKNRLMREKGFVLNSWLYMVPDDGKKIVPLTVSAVDGYLRKAAHEGSGSNRSAIDWYALRHACKSDMLRKGLPADVINNFIGHQATNDEGFGLYREYDFESGLRAMADFIGGQAEKYGLLVPPGNDE